MILYFSGTGNSRYAAERIAAAVGDEVVCLNDRIRNAGTRKQGYEEKYGYRETLDCGDSLVIVTPTYGWRIPRIVRDWVIHTACKANSVWFVMTCGSEIGNAAKYNRVLCEQKGFTYMGTAQIVMPENYIAMFNAPEWKEAEQIIAAAEPAIQTAAERIRANKEFSAPRNNLYDRTMSGIVNPVFYKFFVKADAFYAKESCIGCGKCVTQCPLNNIKLQNGKPVWGSSCTHCMACICFCPREAIEYGKKSIGKPRYRCKK